MRRSPAFRIGKLSGPAVSSERTAPADHVR
jgi:hypothetical protein